jgi:hypothetical protein
VLAWLFVFIIIIIIFFLFLKKETWYPSQGPTNPIQGTSIPPSISGDPFDELYMD